MVTKERAVEMWLGLGDLLAGLSCSRIQLLIALLFCLQENISLPATHLSSTGFKVRGCGEANGKGGSALLLVSLSS